MRDMVLRGRAHFTPQCNRGCFVLQESNLHLVAALPIQFVICRSSEPRLCKRAAVSIIAIMIHPTSNQCRLALVVIIKSYLTRVVDTASLNSQVIQECVKCNISRQTIHDVLTFNLVLIFNRLPTCCARFSCFQLFC